MLNLSNVIFKSNNETICNYIFNKYLNCIDYRQSKSYKHQVYDHYGVIDTLGHSSDNTVNSYSYHDEFTSIFCLFSGGLYYLYIDSSEKEAYISKINPFCN